MLNELTQTVTSTGYTVVNTYNGDGLRAQKSVNGAVTNYLYDANDKVELETDASGNQTALNINGLNLICRKVGVDTLYYIYNGHADVVGLLDTNGNVIVSYVYDAFGNIISQTNTDNFNNYIAYAGYQYDPQTGLYYLDARMYDPITARFLQQDTYTGEYNDPLSLNLYVYCKNNPMTYSDPTGHDSIAANAQVHDVSSYLNVRTGPGMNYAIKGSLDPNETVQVLNSSNSWHYVKYRLDGTVNGTKDGWVSGSYINYPISVPNKSSSQSANASFDSNAKVKDVSINSYLTVRQKPDDNAPEYGKVFEGESVLVDTWGSPYAYITYEKDNGSGTKSGYVHSAYLDYNGVSSGGTTNTGGSNLSLTNDMKKAGVTISNIDGVQYYDYSTPIETMVYSNVDEILKARENTNFLADPYALKWFQGKVGTGKVWDIKQPDLWKGQLPALPFEDKFVFMDQVITPEDLGNITYGYWARAMGYGPLLIYWGGGFANQLNLNHINNGGLTDLQVKQLHTLTVGPLYGDDANDHPFIEQGIDWYDSKHPNDSPILDLNPTVTIYGDSSVNYITQQQQKDETNNTWSQFTGLR